MYVRVISRKCFFWLYLVFIIFIFVCSTLLKFVFGVAMHYGISFFHIAMFLEFLTIESKLSEIFTIDRDPLELLSVTIGLIFFQPQQSYSKNTERCGTSKYGNVLRVYVKIENYSVADYFRNDCAITKLDPTVGATETVLDLFLD